MKHVHRRLSRKKIDTQKVSTHHSLPFLSFPLVGRANTALGLSLFHCSLSVLQIGGQVPSPLAQWVQAVIPNRHWALGDPSSTAAFGPRYVHLWGLLPNGSTYQPSASPFPCSVLLVASASCTPLCVHGMCVVFHFPRVARMVVAVLMWRVGVVGGGRLLVLGGDVWFLLRKVVCVGTGAKGANQRTCRFVGQP